MSRWAETFRALSPPADTVDTVDTVGAEPGPSRTVSHSVNCVTGVERGKRADAPPGPQQPIIADADDLAERAALIECGAGVPRACAEGYARLDPDQPPADVPPQRWLRFVDDVGRFLDGGFAEQAAALGWGPLDLFGADDVRPFARVDRAGLLWLLHGDRLVALTVDAAIIETATGARQTYRRKPNEPGRVLAWDLVPGR